MTLPRPDQPASLRRLPVDLQRMIEEELGENESIVWVGQPNPRLFARRALPAIVFGTLITTASLIAVAVAQGYVLPAFAADDYSGTLVALAFLPLGLGLLTGPFWVMRKAKWVAYVITSHRAIIFAGYLLVEIRSFTPDKLTDLRRRQRANGSGDLIFEHRVLDSSSIDFGFECLDDVKAAEDLIRELTGRREQRRTLLHG